MDISKHIRPINFYQRDKALHHALLNSSSMTSQKLLEIDFGHFPPRGLNVNKPNKQIVTIKSIFEDQEHDWLKKIALCFRVGGYVKHRPLGDKSPRDIYVNKAIYSPLGQYIHAHVFVFLAEKIAPIAKISSLPGLLGVSSSLLGMVFMSSLRFAPLVQLLSPIMRGKIETVGHEHIHILQRDRRSLSETRFDSMATLFKNALDVYTNVHAPKSHRLLRSFDRALSFLGSRDYYLFDHEIQARLHVVIANGYQRWGKVPASRNELWAALIDSGVSAPKSVREELTQFKAKDTQSFQTFCKPGITAKFNHYARQIVDAPTAELNIAYRAHTGKMLKEHFWNATLPYLYGHLLELYGDKEGRAKMGFDKKTRVWHIPAPMPVWTD